MEITLALLVKDWLEEAGWGMLEVDGSLIKPKDNAPHTYMGGSPNTRIFDDKVGGIYAADPEFFPKLDQYLTRKYFSGTAWYQEKINPKKKRQQIWPKS